MEFYLKLDYLAGGNRIPFIANIPITITIYDMEGNVYRKDITYTRLGDTEQFKVSFSGFTVQRPSYAPLTELTHSLPLPVPEIEVRSLFEQTRAVYISFQTRESYDEHDRFDPVNWGRAWNTLAGSLAGLQAGGWVDLEGIFEWVGFYKNPVASSGRVAGEGARAIMGKRVQVPHVRNQIQLENIARAERDREGHRLESYDVMMEYRCNLVEEDGLVFDHELLQHIPESPADTAAGDVTPPEGRNEIRVKRAFVIKSANYSFNVDEGPVMRLTLTRRLHPPAREVVAA